MKGNKGIYKKKYRKIIIRTVEGSTLSGKINLGIKERVSDIFTKADNPFIVLFDVEGQDDPGKVLFVNKNNITYVEPNDE